MLSGVVNIGKLKATLVSAFQQIEFGNKSASTTTQTSTADNESHKNCATNKAVTAAAIDLVSSSNEDDNNTQPSPQSLNSPKFIYSSITPPASPKFMHKPIGYQTSSGSHQSTQSKESSNVEPQRPSTSEKIQQLWTVIRQLGAHEPGMSIIKCLIEHSPQIRYTFREAARRRDGIGRSAPEVTYLYAHAQRFTATLDRVVRSLDTDMRTTVAELQTLGRTHARRQLSIDDKHWELFSTAMITETLRLRKPTTNPIIVTITEDDGETTGTTTTTKSRRHSSTTQDRNNKDHNASKRKSNCRRTTSCRANNDISHCGCINDDDSMLPLPPPSIEADDQEGLAWQQLVKFIVTCMKRGYQTESIETAAKNTKMQEVRKRHRSPKEMRAMAADNATAAAAANNKPHQKQAIQATTSSPHPATAMQLDLQKEENCSFNRKISIATTPCDGARRRYNVPLSPQISLTPPTASKKISTISLPAFPMSIADITKYNNE